MPIIPTLFNPGESNKINPEMAGNALHASLYCPTSHAAAVTCLDARLCSVKRDSQISMQLKFLAKTKLNL